jgi:hypothetical protein
VACKVSGNTGSVEHLWNPGKSTPIYIDNTNPTIGLTNANIIYNGTGLICTFRRNKTIDSGLSSTIQNEYYNLFNNYYLLIAKGDVASGDNYNKKMRSIQHLLIWPNLIFN